MHTIRAIIEQVRSYHPQVDEQLLLRASDFISRAQREQKKTDGHDCLQHSLEVASILVRMKVDETTLVVGLLHDALAGSVITAEELADWIEKHVGAS